MAISYKIIGRHIHTARKQRKLTQEQVAEMMKVTVAHYGRLERGERYINLERLAQISVLLGVPLAQLLDGCLPENETIISENPPQETFLRHMSRYTQFCREETLARMLRVCDVLSEEDQDH